MLPRTSKCLARIECNVFCILFFPCSSEHAVGVLPLVKISDDVDGDFSV